MNVCLVDFIDYVLTKEIETLKSFNESKLNLLSQHSIEKNSCASS